MSAGSKCLENMIAGRLQDIMVILRNQCNNKANLLVTLDSKFWSQPFSFEGVHIRPEKYWDRVCHDHSKSSMGAPDGPARQKRGVRCAFSTKLLFWAENSRKFRNVCRITVLRNYDCRKASGRHSDGQKPMQE